MTFIIIIVAILVLFLFIKGVQTVYKNRYIETPTHKPAVRDIAKEQRTLRVNIDKFIKEYGKGCSIPRDLRIEMIKAIAKGEKYYSITEEEYRTTLENYDKHNKQEQALFKCAELNNKGMAQEKSGNIDLAIETYEENIKGGYPATHSYDRLMILYRKRKDYQNELRVIDAALEVFKREYDQEKYKQRKEKALALLMKEKTNVVCYDMEAPNRFRIFNDSIELIASTPKTSTFILRVGDIENFFIWAEEQTAKGIQIELGKDIAELQKEIYKRINVNAIRIAEKEYTKWLSVDRTSEKKIDNATAKAFEALDELAKCIKTSSNDKQTLEQIEHFRTTIEQIYAEL